MKRDAFPALVTLFALLVTCVFPPVGDAHRIAGLSAGTSESLSRTPLYQAMDQRQLIGARLGIEPRAAEGADGTSRKNWDIAPKSGLPRIMSSSVPFSTALATTLGGRDSLFNNVSVMGDFDGREDLVADHEGIERDFAGETLPKEFTLTRVAISAHTRANGFNENIFFYGDSVGNLYVDATDLSIIGTPNPPPNRFSINLPTSLNAFGSLSSDSQVVITGIAINPVADLSSFFNVNSAYCTFAGQTGEVLYLSFTDTGGGLRLASNNTLVRSGVIAYPIADLTSPANFPATPACGGLGGTPVTPPGVVSPTGFPVTMGGAFGVSFSIFSNLAGVAVDDDGSVYFQNVDLQQFTGGNIVKITSQDGGNDPMACPGPTCPNQDRSLAVSGILTITTLNPSSGLYGTTSGPLNQINRFTNYSGTSTTFGNIAALATGPGNVLYAAVTRSFVATDDPATQNTEGLFSNPAALGATPAMIISFADVIGTFDVCSTLTEVNGNPVNLPFSLGLQIGEGRADPAQGTGPVTAGVNNFRAFVLGTGPDPRVSAGPMAAVFGTPTDTQKVEFQVDFSIYSGLAVDEGGRLYVISGGTPGGVGLNPSPRLGEVLCFEDTCAPDRRADYTDLRGNGLPNPPLSGGVTGDGDSDRFDHIYWQSPIDVITATPTGIAGLARGFLRYLNRTAPNAVANLPNGAVQGDDDTTAGAVNFEDFDPSHQVAGGDDQNTPFRGDDDDGGGNPAIPAPLNGGFEYIFGGTNTSIWNGFFLNSNGSVSFGAGDTSNLPTVPNFRVGVPKIAGAWADLNSSSRVGGFGNTFPVQAAGFAGINQFKVRWINVPEFGKETCSSNNNFAISLFDDGTGIDENANQPLNPANPIGNNAVPFDLQEGPTDQRFVVEPTTGVVVPTVLRRAGSGYFNLEYGRMDLLGTNSRPVITGYSVGALSPLNPPGLCETNLSIAATDVEADFFGTLQGQTGAVDACVIGEGTEPTVYEIFEAGQDGTAGSQGEIFAPVPDFDLRFAGNDPATSQHFAQVDPSHGTAGFFGIGTGLPTSPIISLVQPGPFIPTPTSQGLINAIGSAQLLLYGTGFFPNEVTTVCASGVPNGDIPTPRDGKIVSNAITLTVDSNSDGIAEATVALTNVTPINRNLVVGTLAPLPGLPGTAFPLSGCGGLGTATLTTTFGPGDNNFFFTPPLTRTATGTLNLNVRAPVVLGVTPSEGDCSLAQDVILGGACFLTNVTLPVSGNPTKTGPVAKVFAVEEGNPSNVIQATSINTLDDNTVAARFNLGPANAGKRFLIFVTGPDIPAGGPGPTPSPTPGYTSRNRLTGTPLGNEAGNIVRFSCTGAIANALSLSASNYSITEDCTTVPVTITRSLPSTDPATVEIATSDGSAVQRSDYTATFRTVSFGAGETSKVVEIPITEDSFNEGNETFTVALSNPGGGAGLGGQTSATITIVNDDNPPPGTNAIDNNTNFVCQHYHDFLNRQPDAPGLAFWVSQITACGGNVGCIEQARISVSASFFLSIEFQETGFFVLRSQRAAFGKKSADPLTRYAYVPFLKDTQQVSQGVIIGQPGADALLEANKQAYTTQVVTSAPFIAAYPLAQTAAQYVDALFATAMVVPTMAERNAAITAFGGGGTSGRAAAFRSVVESTSVRSVEFNPAFVLMEYYGYLRRNPTDPPDGNDLGYQFWLTKLNLFNGNFFDAQMVKAFLSSVEYRQRFGNP